MKKHSASPLLLSGPRTQACAATTHAPWYNIEINRLQQQGDAGLRCGLMRGRNPGRRRRRSSTEAVASLRPRPNFHETGEQRSAMLSGSVVLTRGEEKVAEIDDSLWAVHTL